MSSHFRLLIPHPDPTLPNPGSYKAYQLGCTCPVGDNNHGRYPPWQPSGWYIAKGCPVHPWVPEHAREGP